MHDARGVCPGVGEDTPMEHGCTAELDGGPIIQQVTMPVSHRDEVDDLVRIGRDAERLALARALRLVLRRQVMVYGGRTAVFD